VVGSVHDAVGAITSAATVTEVAAARDAGPVFPAASLTMPAFNCATKEPFPVHVTLTDTEGFATAALGVKTHPVAVPVEEKSLARIPDTASENVNE
jgi:hypothetical protein